MCRSHLTSDGNRMSVSQNAAIDILLRVFDHIQNLLKEVRENAEEQRYGKSVYSRDKR